MQMLSDYDRKDLTRDEQIVMATLRSLGFYGTRRMKNVARTVVAQFQLETEFTDLIAENFNTASPESEDKAS